MMAPMTTANVIVIDRDPVVLRELTEAFELQGYRVQVASTGGLALDEGVLDDTDVVLLDPDLPDIGGLEVCRHLLIRTSAPILVVSAEAGETRKVAFLDMGAVDYIMKPFSLPELMARVRVALRHRRALGLVAHEGLLQVGLLRLDFASHEAMLVDQALDLTPKEFALLGILARNAGRVLTHRVILDQVPGSGQSLDTLRAQVSRLRRKIGSSPFAPEVVTVPGVGYRLLPEHRLAVTPSASPAG
jgi:two-component system KDP operon response regulator KdpE